MSRLLLYTDRCGIYGAEQWTHRLGMTLQRDGYVVAFAQPRAQNELVGERQRAGIEHHWIESDDLYERGPDAACLIDRAEPQRILAESAPDLVIFADSCPFANLPAKAVARDGGVPYLSVVHCVTASWATQFAPFLDALQRAYRDAVEVVAVSAENLARLRRHFRLDDCKGRVIVNGRPEEFFAIPSATVRRRVRRDLRIPEDAVLCLTIGRFELVKGYQYLLSVVSRLHRRVTDPKVYFLWVGSGTLESRIRRLIRAVGASEFVRILNPPQNVPELLDAADVFVLPSQFEGMPLVVIEAMAKGLPVIATSVSGTPEALGDTGYLLPDPADGGDLSGLLMEAIAGLAENPAWRASMGDAARARAQSCLLETTMLDRYSKLIRQALGRP